MATTRIIRDASIRVKIQPETKVRLERLSHLYGVPPSTLASVWLGQALAQQERSLSMASRMADAVGGEVGQAIKEQLSMMPELFGQVGQEAPASLPDERKP
jgi:hypothetical protein